MTTHWLTYNQEADNNSAKVTNNVNARVLLLFVIEINGIDANAATISIL